MRKEAILSIVCKGELNLTPDNIAFLEVSTREEINRMEAEGLLIQTRNFIKVTGIGQAFIRNICMLFNHKIKESARNTSSTFSKAI